MNRFDRPIIGALLWLQALFVGSTFDTLIPTAAMMLTASIYVVLSHSRHRSPVASLENGFTNGKHGVFGWLAAWALGTGLLVVCAIWRLSQQSDAEVNVLSVAIDTLAHWAFVVSCLLWMRQPRAGHVGMLPLGMIVLLFAVAAGGVSRSIAAQTTVACLTCIAYLAGANVIMAASRSQLTASGLDAASPPKSRQRAGTVVLSSTIVTLVLVTATVVASITNFALPSVQHAVQQQLRDTIDSIVDQRLVGGTRYVQNGRIGSVREHMLGNPSDVALTVRCDDAPGYLRGRVYDTYRRRRWYLTSQVRQSDRSTSDRQISAVSHGRTKLPHPPSRPLSRFGLDSSSSPNGERGKIRPIILRSNPDKGYVVFAPLGARWIEARAQQIVVNEHDVVVMGVDVRQPYVIGAGSLVPKQSLSPAQRKKLLLVPIEVVAEATRLAGEICGRDNSARRKAASISRFFQREFAYSLAATSIPDNADPIEYFLRKRHPAHCEFFAASTVLLLRAAGVPARYVTGYVADELDTGESDVWLARNQDAHAWAEAYDEVSQQWFAVESTPGRAYRSIGSFDEAETGNPTGDRFLDEQEFADAGLPGQAWRWIVALSGTSFLAAVFRWTLVPLLIFLIGFWWLQIHHRSGRSASAIDAQCNRMLRAADRRIKKYSMVRLPSETLCQFADRIDEQSAASNRLGAADQMTGLARWYRQFAYARYQGTMPLRLDQFSS